MAAFETCQPLVRSESIYNLLPKQEVKKVKPPMYKSDRDHSKSMRNSMLDPGGGVGRLYGTPGTGSADPRNFLRKGGGGAAAWKGRPRTQGDDRPRTQTKQKQKPPVPRRSDRPLTGLQQWRGDTDKNFITANAVKAILAVPKAHPALPDDYLNKEDFGKVPAYLEHVKAEIAAETEMIDTFVREQMGLGDREEHCESMQEMSEQERASLLEGLKAKWDSTNAKYQRLCHQTSFENRRLAHKKSLEEELDTLEGDIAKLSTHGPVMIVEAPSR